MSVKPLKRYGPATNWESGIGEYSEPCMKEVSGGNYIDEDELRKRLNEMLESACDTGEKDALHSVLKLIDTPNW